MGSLPQLGVGALVIKQENVLLVRRANSPKQGLWTVPGGRVRLGETLQQAVEREVLEETGLRVRAGRPVHVFDLIEGEPGHWQYHYVIVDLMASYLEGELEAGDDALEARWFRAEELDDPQIDDETRNLIAKARHSVPDL